MLVDIDLIKNLEKHTAHLTAKELKEFNSYIKKDHVQIKEGIYLGQLNIGHWIDFKEEYFEVDGIYSYGVVDNLDQLLELIPTVVNSEDRKFAINLSEIKKEDQPAKDGWRWHKWGNYHGKQEPTCEYIYDEPNVEKVFIYQLYEL
jgi:hypothetical protein